MAPTWAVPGLFKYGPLMEIMFFEVWHFDETCSSVTMDILWNEWFP